MKYLQDLLTLYMAPGIGSSACKKLVEFFGTPGQVLAARRSVLKQVNGIKSQAIDALQDTASLRAAAEKEIIRAKELGISIIHWQDDSFPAHLNNIHNGPAVLYVKGNIECLNTPSIGIVGARAATSYGKNIASSLAMRLSEKGITIISGMALGIDTAAHQGTLAAGGKTIAVLGCGLDIVYPAENKKLFCTISKQGAVVSEYPFGTTPDSFRFPARNRIISGLSLGIVVVEAAKKSGSLITAHLALEQGREVFAVPGRVDSIKSEGTHLLLKEGAKLVHSIDDVLEELHPGFLTSHSPGSGVPENTALEKISAEEKEILAFLETYPKTIDEIIINTKLATHKVSETLLVLELKNLIESLPGKQYRSLVDTTIMNFAT